MLEFIQAVQAASFFGSFLHKTELGWHLLPLGLKWRAGYFCYIRKLLLLMQECKTFKEMYFGYKCATQVLLG